MRVTQPMVDHIPAAQYQCPSCGTYRLAVTMVWSGTVERYVCRMCEPDGLPSLAAVLSWKGKVRAK